MSIDKKALEVAKHYVLSREELNRGNLLDITADAIAAYESARQPEASQQPVDHASFEYARKESEQRVSIMTAAAEDLKRQEYPMWWAYEKASPSCDQSALCFYKGNSLQDIVHGELADYLYPILNAHFLAGDTKRESGCQKCDLEMERVKACEHIAEGEEGWEALRNTCPSTMAVADLRDKYDRLKKMVNTPELFDFIKAVPVEAVHQRERWGEEHDKQKEAPDWFWLVGYVAGKALSAWKTGDTDKLRHHIITTAAVCANWHASLEAPPLLLCPKCEIPFCDCFRTKTNEIEDQTP